MLSSVGLVFLLAPSHARPPRPGPLPGGERGDVWRDQATLLRITGPTTATCWFRPSRPMPPSSAAPRTWSRRMPPKPLDQERQAQTRAEEDLVPQRTKMAHRLRRPHQRRQTTPRPQSQQIQRRRWHEALGRSRRHRRQHPQLRRRQARRSVTPILHVLATKRPAFGGALRYRRSYALPSELGFLRRKVV